jgi:hypothetical protein
MNNEELIKENLLLKEEIDLLKEKLKNYTAPKRSKKFYETHKEEIKQKVSGKLPNAAGRFFIVSLTECKCNGCNTVYPKSKFYKTFVPDVKHYRNSKKVTV